jgi:hypothetical protein
MILWVLPVFTITGVRLAAIVDADSNNNINKRFKTMDISLKELVCRYTLSSCNNCIFLKYITGGYNKAIAIF